MLASAATTPAVWRRLQQQLANRVTSSRSSSCCSSSLAERFCLWKHELDICKSKNRAHFVAGFRFVWTRHEIGHTYAPQAQPCQSGRWDDHQQQSYPAAPSNSSTRNREGSLDVYWGGGTCCGCIGIPSCYRHTRKRLEPFVHKSCRAIPV